jgi:hypothetical protein
MNSQGRRRTGWHPACAPPAILLASSNPARGTMISRDAESSLSDILPEAAQKTQQISIFAGR